MHPPLAVSKRQLVGVQRKHAIAGEGPALKLALASEHFSLGPPAEADLPFAPPGQITERIFSMHLLEADAGSVLLVAFRYTFTPLTNEFMMQDCEGCFSRGERASGRLGGTVAALVIQAEAGTRVAIEAIDERKAPRAVSHWSSSICGSSG